MKHRTENDMPDTPSGKFAAQLRATMRRHGISQVELAKRSGIATSNVCRILSGNINVKLETIDKLLAAISADLAYEITIVDLSSEAETETEKAHA